MKKFIYPLLLLAALLTYGCGNDDAPKDVSKEIVMYVSEETGITYNLFDDKQEHPIECMLVREGGSQGAWMPLVFGAIEGFVYERGHSYELMVRKTILANPPQDAANCTYKLVRVIDDRTVEAPEIPAEKEINSEADIPYCEGCPYEKYAIDPEVRVDASGNIFNSEGSERPSYNMARLYIENILAKDDPDWVRFNSITYMPYYAYVVSPLTDKIRLVYTSGGGPMLKDVLPEEEFAHIRETPAEGEQLHYTLILANIHKEGLQKLSFSVHKVR